MTAAVGTRELLQDALRQLRHTRAALDAVEGKPRQPIAVLGAGVRLPGGVSDLPSLWALLEAGRDAVVPMTTPPDGRRDPIEARPVEGEWGGQLEAVDAFDSEFFGISAAEADHMDPQQRLALEVAWEAVEDAGLTLAELREAVTGVFLGIYGSDYLTLQLADPDRATAYTAPGAAHSIAANRLSYLLDLHGPSVVVDTACSSSLVAVHLACRALRAGDCDLALVGGVNLILSPVSSLLTGKVLPLSPTGRCRTFDAGADGIVRGEGCGMLVLARDTDASAARRRVRARIRGSAVNHDGRTNGLTAPNPRAQAQLIERALADGGCGAADVAFVEAHGTGTTLGDPIEVEALAEVYGRGERPCALGALKSNIGHLEAAAGIAGLIKAMLVLERREVPRNLHLERLNPEIAVDRTRLRIPVAPMAVSKGELAAVSSFGFGGTNAHVILGEGDRAEGVEVPDGRGDRLMLPISARSGAALATLSRRYAELLDDWQEHQAARICAAAAHRRTHHSHRACVVGDTAAELRQELERTATFRAVAPSRHPRIGFLFSGQGTQWPAMGAELLTSEPTFSAEVEACEAVARDLTGWSVIEELRAAPAESRVHITEVAQLAIATLQLGLAALWRSWGVEPDAVAGHSMGEIVAACVAGAIRRRDAFGLLLHRARIAERAARGGRMASIGLDVEVVGSLLEAQGGRVGIAAINGPRSTVVSGEAGAVESVVAAAAELGARTRVLPVEYAFHSPLLDGCAEQLETATGAIPPAAARIPLYSTVTGERIAGERLDSAHWARNLRNAVLFAPAIRALSRDGVRVLVEIGPHPALGGDVEATLEALTGAHVVLGSLRRGAPSRLTLGRALADVYCAGVSVRWDAVVAAPVGEVALPHYPWQRRRHWLSDPAPARVRRDAGIQSSKPSELTAPPADPPVLVAVEPQAPDVDALTMDVCERIAAAMGGADVGEVAPDAPLEELGLDSIVIVELKNQLERDLGIRVPLQVLLEAETSRHLAEGVVASLGDNRSGGRARGEEDGVLPSVEVVR